MRASCGTSTPPRVASWRDCRSLGGRSATLDAALPGRSTALLSTPSPARADVPDPPWSAPLRAGLLRQSSSQRARSIRNASLSRRRGTSRAARNIAALFARSHQRTSTTTVLRLAALSGGHSAQAAAHCATARRSLELPPASSVPCNSTMLKTPGSDRRRWSRSWLLVLQHDEQAVLTAVELALERPDAEPRRTF